VPAKTKNLNITDRLALIAAFGVAMGYLEAVVVVYIRRILDIVPPPENLDASVMARMPEWLIAIEQTREAATIVMLFTFAWLVGRDLAGRVATFLVAFGVWDLAYYAGLKVLIDWPQSLMTLDCLFLIPEPWIWPVWRPMAISAGLVVAGRLWLLRRHRACGKA
jgi:hypothetical protein